MSAIEAAFFGTLSRDAEAKISGSGKSYVRLSIRASEGDHAQFISAIVFDQSAIDIAEKFIKGAKVYVEGRISVTEWIGQDGKQRHGLSCMTWHCRLSHIGRQRPARHKTTNTAPASVVTDLNDSIPF